MREQSLTGTSVRRLARGASPAIKELLMTAHEQGFEVGRTNSGHYKVVVPRARLSPGDRATVYLPGTTSDRRSVYRCVVKLKRIGVKFPKS